MAPASVIGFFQEFGLFLELDFLSSSEHSWVLALVNRIFLEFGLFQECGFLVSSENFSALASEFGLFREFLLEVGSLSPQTLN